MKPINPKIPEKIVGDGFEYRIIPLIHPETGENAYKIELNLHDNAFTIFTKPNGIICLTKNDTQKKYFIIENQLYELLSEADGSVDNKGYMFIKTPVIGTFTMRNETFMLVESEDDYQLYMVDKIVECTGDDTCEHCDKCNTCAALHCKRHKS